MWKIAISPYEDSGWGSEKCGNKNMKPVIICQYELPQMEEALRVTVDNTNGLDKTGADMFGEIYSHNIIIKSATSEHLCMWHNRLDF